MSTLSLQNIYIMAKKYRPSLTMEQIDHIIKLLYKQNPSTAIDRICIAELGGYYNKIHTGRVGASYEMTTKQEKELKRVEQIAQSIGETIESQSQPIDRDAIRKIAYDKWKQNPQSCSVDELEMVTDYTIAHGLNEKVKEMTFEEEMAALGLTIQIQNPGSNGTD